MAVETLFRPPDAAIEWWWETAPVALVANATLVAIVSLLLFGLTGRPATATLATLALLLLISLAHASTLGALGRPLFPWDVLLFREAINLQPYLASMPHAWAWAGGATALVAALAASWRYGPRATWTQRVALVVPFAAAATWLFPLPSTALQELGVHNLSWMQVQNYRTNGLPLSFVMNLPAASVVRPNDYSARSVKEALSRGVPHETNAESPDVIVVMSESFFDVTTVPGVTFEEDPLPNLHRLQREAASGALFTPTFGGGTANTEFEFLTGHSMRFLPYGSVPYQQYVRREQNALPRILQSHGYATQAVHIFHRWFWDREQVYERLGIERFVSMEGVEVTGGGYFPRDENLTREVIKTLDAATQPTFLFAVGVEAHGPYEANRYPETTVRFTGPLDEAATAELSTYCEAIKHADEELGRLVTYLEKRGRPAMLLFFGDHLPSLPLTLRQTGLARSPQELAQLPMRERAFLYKVPLVMWNSQRPGRRDLGTLSTTFLSSLILSETATAGTPYTDFIDGVRTRFSVVTPDFVADSNGEFLESLPDDWERIQQEWWLLEYDALFGDNYVNQHHG